MPRLYGWVVSPTIAPNTRSTSMKSLISIAALSAFAPIASAQQQNCNGPACPPTLDITVWSPLVAVAPLNQAPGDTELITTIEGIERCIPCQSCSAGVRVTAMIDPNGPYGFCSVNVWDHYLYGDGELDDLDELDSLGINGDNPYRVFNECDAEPDDQSSLTITLGCLPDPADPAQQLTLGSVELECIACE